MPVTTRSKSRLLSTAQDGGLQPPFKPSKTVKHPFKSLDHAAPKQLYQLDGAQPSTQRTPKKSPTAQDPSNQTSPQDSGKKEPLQTITKPHSASPVPSNITKAFWPCRECPCHDGTFKDLVDNCLMCGHSMFDHEPHPEDHWYHRCDYPSERDELVTSVLQHARNCAVIVIRATPMVGKTTLLKLLGHHITHHELDLEPVYIQWESRQDRNGLPYEEYLAQEKITWQERNAESRPCNPRARTIYLIDEAQRSYEEDTLWAMLKNYHNTRDGSLFVLVCVYGAAGTSPQRETFIESQARLMHSMQRIELRPSTPGSPYMLFKQEDTDAMLRKFALYHKCQLDNGVVEYLHRATGGHPGMLGVLLSHVKTFCRETGVPVPRTLSPEFLHELIVQHEDSFVEWLGRWGRGVWSPRCEGNVQKGLRKPEYSHIQLLDVKKALREVAIQPDGLTRRQKDFDAFALCHKAGLLHTEQPLVGSEDTKFTFPSPLHRRVAYRRLFPGREPDAVLKDLNLRQICINAIARFSPGALQNRRYSQSSGSWGIPEAAFQDELYCCLNRELHYVPILSEYSHTKDGRIDFYISDQKWGIEVLQCGSNAEIDKHIARFAYGGKYQRWEIMDDYVILNFCPRAALREVKIKDEQIKSHLFHIVVEPEEFTAEIYTHDIQLCQAWSLSEGRQRASTEFYDFNDAVSDTANCAAPLQDEPTQRRDGTTVEMEERERRMEEREREMDRRMEEREREMERRMEEREREMERQMEGRERERERQMEERERGRERQMEERERERERQMEEMRVEMEREKEKIRLQREREDSKEQDKPVLGRDRKRKR
ncbi:hypothetical protein B0J12DRAFT_764734 [Macrophomina phaseolina]|uniref:AAA+ ATPase domain-containing protein n=1 Tax=Macrophomina phaseolina TaxID=35725 RepID=A0ABQ8FZU2_9PEZI|nr:hypothetical protein B0J12DRAFT_764734 [Macrophomina phaseolina]